MENIERSVPVLEQLVISINYLGKALEITIPQRAGLPSDLVVVQHHVIPCPSMTDRSAFRDINVNVSAALESTQRKGTKNLTACLSDPHSYGMRMDGVHAPPSEPLGHSSPEAASHNL